MTLAAMIAKLKLPAGDAASIFDRDEPVGTPTDLVLPRRRWFRRRIAGESERDAMSEGCTGSFETTTITRGA